MLIQPLLSLEPWDSGSKNNKAYGVQRHQQHWWGHKSHTLDYRIFLSVQGDGWSWGEHAQKGYENPENL